MMSKIERMKPKDRRMLAGTRASSHLLCSGHMRIQTSLKSQDPNPPSFLLVNIGKTALATIVSIKVAGHEGTHTVLRIKAIPSQPLCRTSGATKSPKSNCCQERCIPQPYSAFTQAPTTNTRGVDGHGQPFDLPTISPLATPLGFEPMTLALIPLVGPHALPTLLKVIVVRKGAYPSLIVHSPKRPRRTQGELMDTTNPPIC